MEEGEKWVREGLRARETTIDRKELKRVCVWGGGGAGEEEGEKLGVKKS